MSTGFQLMSSLVLLFPVFFLNMRMERKISCSMY